MNIIDELKKLKCHCDICRGKRYDHYHKLVDIEDVKDILYNVLGQKSEKRDNLTNKIDSIIYWLIGYVSINQSIGQNNPRLKEEVQSLEKLMNKKYQEGQKSEVHDG